MQSYRWAKVKEMTVLLHEAQHRLDSAMWLSPTSSPQTRDTQKIHHTGTLAIILDNRSSVGTGKESWAKPVLLKGHLGEEYFLGASPPAHQTLLSY